MADRPTSWQARAACRDAPTGVFYVRFWGRNADADAAAHTAYLNDLYCSACPVRTECAAAGRREQGVWGGEDEDTRRRNDRRRQKAARLAAERRAS